MAPDINSLANHVTDGYPDNGVPRRDTYEIPDIVLGGPFTRKIKVLSIGAGVTGTLPYSPLLASSHFIELGSTSLSCSLPIPGIFSSTVSDHYIQVS